MGLNSYLSIDIVDLAVEETSILEHSKDYFENLLVYLQDKKITVEEIS